MHVDEPRTVLMEAEAENSDISSCSSQNTALVNPSKAESNHEEERNLVTLSKYTDSTVLIRSRRSSLELENTALPTLTPHSPENVRGDSLWRGCYCCHTFPPYKIGRFIVVCPHIYKKSSKGIIGPHWYGVMVAYSILFYASYHIILVSWSEIGTWSGTISVMLTVITTVTLFLTSCSDPGIVRSVKKKNRERSIVTGRYELVDPDHDDDTLDDLESNFIFEDMNHRDWRYCGHCDVFQPPGAVHCPFCQVCIEGYDHHCPWMGMCIGRKNMKYFISFNFSWVLYLFYAMVWVSFLGKS